MRDDSPLQYLAEDIYRVLFCHPDCYGSTKISDRLLAGSGNVNIPDALRATPSIDGKRDTLILRDTFENEIVDDLLRVMAEHKQAALEALNNATSTADSMIERDTGTATPASTAPAKKRTGDGGPYDGPAKRTRSKATGSVPKA
ncbi:hypothetical protein GGI17_002320 [Coemansia sp. S146]|nr:hypothetical protein GGI17_002320 [Coemansia sp. S146]